MRRLAQQTRDDVYASLRDYQELHTAQGQGFRSIDGGDRRLLFAAQADGVTSSDIVGAGLYIWPSTALRVTLQLDTGDVVSTGMFELGGGHWNRLGLAADSSGTDGLWVELRWSGAVDIGLWGLSAGPLELPPALVSAGVNAAALNVTHLAPETFYLIHDVAIGMDLVEEDSALLHLPDGPDVTLKKCSYCGRMLPLDLQRLGTLGFHKHNDKRTKHQNECRACKKWRINNDFNPRRTVDQLHESSVITRERKLFLREPERLQEYKVRTGAGLKSQVWERFGRKCFYCSRPLELAEVQLDHTRPLACLWPIDEYATCLCAEHNNQKTDKFPVDFYNETQLRDLSRITGLPLRDLKAKSLNLDELERIRKDVSQFARQWEPRTFASTARKVAEVLPEVDLFDDLHQADPEQYSELVAILSTRGNT